MKAGDKVYIVDLKGELEESVILKIDKGFIYTEEGKFSNMSASEKPQYEYLGLRLFEDRKEAEHYSKQYLTAKKLRNVNYHCFSLEKLEIIEKIIENNYPKKTLDRVTDILKKPTKEFKTGDIVFVSNPDGGYDDKLVNRRHRKFFGVVYSVGQFGEVCVEFEKGVLWWYQAHEVSHKSEFYDMSIGEALKKYRINISLL